MPVNLVLIGAGHAHLAVLARTAQLRCAGVMPVLIAPETFDYSGLASGVLSGDFLPDRARIDVAVLARRNAVPHIVSEVIGVDRVARRVNIADGSVLSYDAISCNIGSTVADPLGLASREGVWPVKPLAALFALRRALEATFSAGAPTPAIVVAGDGQTGFEVAAALTGLHERHGRAVNLTLVGPDTQARWAPGLAGRSLIRNLDRRGVRRVAARIVAHAAGQISLCDGRTLACDHLALATGLRAPALTQTMGLPLDDVGRIKVAPILCSVGDDRVFAVGDCAAIKGWPRPFAGVFGVRAADTLIDNLCTLGSGERPCPYRPQAKWLSIMDLGDGTGLAMRGRFWWQGRAALKLKRWLDLGFVSRSRA